MKKILCVVALLLSCGGLALAKIQSKSNIDQPVGAQRSGGADVRRVNAKRKRAFVRCRNGSVSYSLQNVCLGRGGQAEFQQSTAASGPSK